MKKLTILTLIAALAVPATVMADDLNEAHDTNRNILGEADPASRELLLRPVRLKRGRTYTLPVTLQSGKYYTFFGDCDDDCSNMDMDLLNSGGARVASDRLPDAQPLFTYRATQSGNYRIVLSMKACSDSDGCKASIHAFEGNRRVYDTFMR